MSNPPRNRYPAELVPSTEFTMATLTAEEQARTENLMTNLKTAAMKMQLAPGSTLVGQCNANYAYLNHEGISMGQLVGSLDAVQSAANVEGSGVQREEFRSGEVNPLSGEYTTASVFEVKVDTDDSATRALATAGISPVEIALARHGIFGRSYVGRCRAEDMLRVLRSSPIGREALDQADPQAPPIALLPETPESPAAVGHEEGAVPKRPRRGFLKWLAR